MEKVLLVLGAKYPLAHVVTHHYTLALGASMSDMEVLFNGQIPTKIMIGLMSKEDFVRAWRDNPISFMDLN